MNEQDYDVCVVGGAGHIGVSLSLVMANRGVRTLINDINEHSLSLLRKGEMPFMEEGAEPLLARALSEGMLGFSSDPADVAHVPILIVTIGTPVDDFHNPDYSLLENLIDALCPYLNDDQTLILRSTVAPGTTRFLELLFKKKNKNPLLSFCPERVVQGRGIEEIQKLPQIVSATSEEALRIAKELFGKIAPELVEMTPAEAEYAKLVCNSYRYLQFAATNQLYMLVNSAGIDYGTLIEKLKKGYPRMFSIPRAGFAAGPCLMKDTLQLFSFGKHRFPLGQVAIDINEGLANYVIEKLALAHDLRHKIVGILGMAFKAESDDVRYSLSYKLRKGLRFKGAHVICSDEFVRDSAFVTKEQLVERSEIVIVGAPHEAYVSLEIPSEKTVLDVWSIL